MPRYKVRVETWEPVYIVDAVFETVRELKDGELAWPMDRTDDNDFHSVPDEVAEELGAKLVSTKLIDDPDERTDLSSREFYRIEDEGRRVLIGRD